MKVKLFTLHEIILYIEDLSFSTTNADYIDSTFANISKISNYDIIRALQTTTKK